MDKRSRCGVLLPRLACCVWLMVTVKLATGVHCPNTTPHNCTCNEDPFAVSCINTGFEEIPSGLPDAPSMTINDNNILTLANIPYGNLVQLILINNKIAFVQDNVFKHLNSLTKLILSRNQITRLGEDAFAGLVSLTTLVLNGNPLYHVKSETFKGSRMPMLSTLKLSQCSIYEISENAFDGLAKLQDLDISYNYITSLTSAVGGKNFPRELVTLDASHNRIAEIGNDDFGGLTNLDTLILSNNKIKTISSKAFKGLHNNLTTLDLSHNNLNDISPIAFKYMPVLNMLSLQFNSLTSLDMSAIPWRDDEPIVLVHDNPWCCSCDMKWLIENKFVSSWNTNGTTKCASPKDVEGEDLFKTEHGVFHHCYHSVSTAVIVTVVFFGLLSVAVIGFIVYRRFFHGRLRDMTDSASDKVKVLSPPYRRV